MSVSDDVSRAGAFRLDGAHALPDQWRGGAAALGNFDGLHLGHQAVLRSARDLALAQGGPWLLLTFDPHPAAFFKPPAAPFLLTTLDQRARLAARLGVAGAVVIPFDADLAALTPEAFARDILAGRLGLRAVATGEDFTFGKGRSGNAATLATLGAALGFATASVAPVATPDGRIISSTRVRGHLTAGEPEQAARLLGRPWSIRGLVQPGEQRGRKLGFPTLNVALGDYLRPRYGVYAIRAQLADGRELDGVANVGVRPTFDPPVELLEAHLFDFAEDIYGQMVDVALIAFLRPERRFAALDALVAQIDRDRSDARLVLGAHPPELAHV